MFLGKQYAMPSVWPSSQTPVAEKTSQNKKPKSAQWTSVWAEAVHDVQRADRLSDQLIASWSR